ncbi:hypothetical protein Tco_1279953, partial [Tanacetum coccineum]
RLRDEADAKNEDFLNKLNDNIKKIIKDQVIELVKAQVSKILLKIKKTINEQLEAEVLTCSSNKSKTSHAVSVNLYELELKKILIHKMESNKSIYISDEQKNLYKALVDAYESDKLILDTYGDNVLFKRRQDDEDKDEEPSVRSNRGSKRRRAGKEPESTSAPKEKTSKTTRKSTKGSKSHHKSAGESEIYKATNNQLDWNNPEGQQYPYDLRKPLPLIPNSQGHRVIPFDHFINNDLVESARDVYSKRRIIAVTKLQIVEWHNYKHLDWICKLINLTAEERLAFNVSLRMFTRSVVIQRRMEDLLLAYTTYSNPRGFIYQNKDKKNRLMRIDELHKFSDGTLNDIRNTLDDRLKGILMKYLPQTI